MLNKNLQIIVPEGREPVDPVRAVEYNIAPEVTESMELIFQDLPSVADDLSKEVLEKELLKLRDVHYKASRLRSEGKSFEQIGKLLNIDTFTAKRYVNRVLQLHYNLYPREAELLNQQVVEQLDLMTNSLYEVAKSKNQINENGEVFLNTNQIMANLAILDRKVKILNIEPPKRVKIELSDQVLKAQEKMRQRLDSYEAIDVTPNKGENHKN